MFRLYHLRGRRAMPFAMFLPSDLPRIHPRPTSFYKAGILGNHLFCCHTVWCQTGKPHDSLFRSGSQKASDRENSGLFRRTIILCKLIAAMKKAPFLRCFFLPDLFLNRYKFLSIAPLQRFSRILFSDSADASETVSREQLSSTEPSCFLSAGCGKRKDMRCRSAVTEECSPVHGV